MVADLGSADVGKSRILIFLVGMYKSKSKDEEWAKLAGVLKKNSGIRVGCEATCRRFVQALLWILRSGAQWRLLPDRFGHWNSVFKRFACLMPVRSLGRDAGPYLSQG